MIICFVRKQIKIFMTLNSFEMNMSFKRIRKTNMNEIVFVYYCDKQHKNNVIIC